MEKIMKRIASVSLPIAALAMALSAGDVHARSSPWSVSFDMGTQVAPNGDVHRAGTVSRRWSMPNTGSLTIRF
jgi:hypothetical protein